MKQVLAKFHRLATLFFPGGGVVLAALLTMLAMPVFILVWLAAAAAALRFVSKDKTDFLFRCEKSRVACFYLMLAACAFPGAVLLAAAGTAAVLIEGLRYIAKLPRRGKLVRSALELAGLALIVAATVGGFSAFKTVVTISRSASYSCSGIPREASVISREIIEPYEIFAFGDRKIVSAYAGVHFIDEKNRRAFKPEFEYAVFDYFNPKTKIFAGGGKGTETAFVYDAGKDKFLFHEKIGRSDIMDTDFFNGKYYLLGENGNIILIDAKTYERRVVKTSVMFAYAMKINSRTGKLYISSWASGKIVKFDARTFKVEEERIFWSPVFNIDANENMNTLLVTLPFRSKIYELNGDTLTDMREIPAGFGVRDIVYAPNRNVIYAANNYDGTFTGTAYDSGVLLKKVFIGANARGVYRDPDSERLYAVSRCGVFEIK